METTLSPQMSLMNAINSARSPLLYVTHSPASSPMDILKIQEPQEPPVQAKPSTSNSTGATSSLQFQDLPLEIRDHIWEYTLPEPRLFHVHQIRRFHHANLPTTSTDQTGTGTTTTNSLLPRARIRFYINHPPPITTQICTESRRAALRVGLVLLPAICHKESKGRHPKRTQEIFIHLWFNTGADILYLDRNLRNSLTLHPEDSDSSLRLPWLQVQNLNLVRHVGLEWRSLLRDGSDPVSEYSSARMRALWCHKLDTLYAYFPKMRVLHYVMPVVRYQGGYPWGREPGGFNKLPAKLTGLPGRAVIPVDSGHRPWGDVKMELKAAFGHEDVEKHVRGWFEDEVSFPVEVVGDWLVREGLPERFSNESIRVFDY